MIFFFFSTLQLCVLTHCLWFLAHKWWLQISQSVHFEGKRSAAGGFSKFQNCIHCVRMFLCFLCFHGAVSNRGRHDRVGKARERARGKGATRQAHPAGARRPGAGHRSQQVWTLLRRPRSPLPVWLGTARHSLARPRKHQSKVGIVQDWFSITCWPHEETQNSSLTRSTPRLSMLCWSPWFW